MKITPELREKVAAAIWNVDASGNPKWDELHPKADKTLRGEIYKMADAAMQVMAADRSIFTSIREPMHPPLAGFGQDGDVLPKRTIAPDAFRDAAHAVELVV